MRYAEVAKLIKTSNQDKQLDKAPVTTLAPATKPVNDADKAAPRRTLPAWAATFGFAALGIHGLLGKLNSPNYYAQKPKRAVTPLAMDSNIMNRTLYG